MMKLTVRNGSRGPASEVIAPVRAVALAPSDVFVLGPSDVLLLGEAVVLVEGTSDTPEVEDTPSVLPPTWDTVFALANPVTSPVIAVFTEVTCQSAAVPLNVST